MSPDRSPCTSSNSLNSSPLRSETINLLKLATSSVPHGIAPHQGTTNPASLILPIAPYRHLYRPINSLVCDDKAFVPRYVDNDLTDDDEKEEITLPVDDKKASGRKRSTRNISLLCLQLSSELQRSDTPDAEKTRDALAIATGFARQRICTVVSVYKAIGLITENRLRKGILEWNVRQSKMLPEAKKHIRHYFDTKRLHQYMCRREALLARKLVSIVKRNRLAKASQVVLTKTVQRPVTLSSYSSIHPCPQKDFKSDFMSSSCSSFQKVSNVQSSSSSQEAPPSTLTKCTPQIEIQQLSYTGGYASSPLFQSEENRHIDVHQVGFTSNVVSVLAANSFNSFQQEALEKFCYSNSNKAVGLKSLHEQQKICQSLTMNMSHQGTHEC
ncbi:hypothetical protein P9112_002730 [Eukaryota sp. TZLM1-RC]